jgi:hypothetical protein
VSANPYPGAFPHQHHDRRGLVERIEAQLRERIEEAVDMAGLKLMVDLRQRHGRAAPDASSETDRRESERIAAELLAHVRDAFLAELTADERVELERVEAGNPGRREGLLAGQVFLARRLPDYWQRFEAHQAAYAAARLEAPPSRQGWLSRLFGN